MSEPVPAIAVAVPAATIVLLRDTASGLEVLVMERHKTMGFAAGAVVFPGGKVDATDSDPGLRKYLSAPDEAELPLLEYRFGGIRELFEEAGILLAESGVGGGFDLSRRRELAARYREGLLANTLGLLDMAQGERDGENERGGEGMKFQASSLHHFSHWITPEPVPKRFDTQFFVAEAPPEQWDLVEGNEAVAMYWRGPAALLADEAEGNIGLMLPTRMNLQILARQGCVADVITEAGKADVVTVMPKIVKEGDEVFLELPEEAGYGVTRVPRGEVFEARLVRP